MKKITLGHPLIQLESVDSTNLHASRMLRTGQAEEGTVILAGFQTQGRGQGDNRWESERGRNLLMSIILRPTFLPVMKQFYLSMAVATGIREYVSKLGVPAAVKWPNDILVGGRKLAGILIENTVMASCLSASVIGIGLNVNQDSFPEGLVRATSLRLETGGACDLPGVMLGVLSSVENSLNVLLECGFREIRTTYLNCLWKLNTPSTFTDSMGSFDGRIIDVADSGELMVMKKNGETVLYEFREVSF